MPDLENKNLSQVLEELSLKHNIPVDEILVQDGLIVYNKDFTPARVYIRKK